MTHDTTTAERIAAQYDDDGQTYEVDGVSIEDACESAGGHRRAAGEVHAVVDFQDGSAIVFTPAYWDIRVPGCEGACHGPDGCTCGEPETCCHHHRSDGHCCARGSGIL